MVAVVVAPIVVLLVRALGDDVLATNYDTALVELRVRDVGGSDTPLVGSYQRFGFNQPGPLLFYALSVPYRLLGSRFAALEIGAMLVNIAAVAAVAWVAFRRGGALLLAWSMLLVAVLVHGVGPSVLRDPWEPDVTILPFAALLLLVWDVTLGRTWTLPLVVIVGSFMLQAQTNFGVVVAVLGTFALAVPAWHAFAGARESRDEHRRALVRPVLVSAALGLLLWLPPLVEQVTGHPGNMREIYDFVRTPQDTLGLADGWRAVALQFGPRAPWLGFDTPLRPLTTEIDTGAAPLVPIGLLVLVAGLAVAAWRRRTAALLLCTIALLAVAASVYSYARLVGPVFVWLGGAPRVVGMACWLAGGYAIADALLPGEGAAARERFTRLAVPVLAVAALALTIASTIDAATHDRRDDPIGDAIDELGVHAATTLRDEPGPVHLRSEVVTGGTRRGSEYGLPPLVLQLERRGVDVVVDENVENRFGEERAEPHRARTEVLLVDGDGTAQRADGFRTVLTVDPMPPGAREERARLQRELARYDDPASDPRAVAMYRRLANMPDHPLLSLVARPA
jgi:hypothetical protein